ncbi:ATP-binding protein [Kribbella shirazensis]|uniref:Signal transduction histidine kinase/phage shock protein PspC (Stress-responsive transcriptional regulator) n=1 Tax=Kribbella shirazensis TaxID=1105143 RepID=A0A7X5VJJ9_9ACTN|nr:ATP-binding protein [Kribbella shirazensis]NIK62398.1 signal transduction histidine kinase/phage shock protein PspC (stress-responsive transcriptional regulator) [Kribbella shirazensis]
MSQPAAAPPGGSSAEGGQPESTPGQNQDQWRYKGWGPQGPGQYQGPYAAYAARMGNQQQYAAPGGPPYSTPPYSTPYSTPPYASLPPRQPTDAPRRAYRRTEGRVVAGVAGGVADHLGVSDTVVRLVLIATTVFGGFGVLIYAALWFLMPLAPETVPAAPGLAAHTRSGLRTDEPPAPVAEAKQRKREKSRGQLPALVAIGAGLLILLQVAGLGIAGKLFWPLVFAATGLALIWRQADESQKDKWTQDIRVPILGLVLGKGGWKSLIRIGVGLVLLGTAVTLFLVQNGRLSMVGDVLIALLLAVVGIGVIAGPWVHRLTRDLNAERAERVRSQERADMAAHLHDSVLQTLALIQKQADDPKAVARLARSQERELRSWLYDEDDQADQTIAGAAKRAAAEVEDSHGVPIEVVTVGDCDLTEPLASMVRAARESMVNAAKHSGAAKIDVFVEVDGDRVEMFVRDRGKGFDVDEVPDDRLGLRHSVMGRMERHGGRATVRSDPETGTEVRLEMDR